MSAYVVEDKTINKIATFVKDWDGARYLAKEFKAAEVEAADPVAFGTALHALNVRAVNQRYNDSATPFDYRYTAAYAPGGKVEVFRAIRCLRYQCTEGDAPESPVYVLLEAIMNDLACQIVGGLPQYDKMAWA